MKLLKYLFIVFPLIGITIFLFPSCEGSEETISDIESIRQFQLDNTFENEILPLHETFKTLAETLHQSAVAYNDQPSIAAFETLQHQWIQTATQWKKCELYNFGPVSEKFLHNRIGKWPIDTEKVETLINGNHTFNALLIQNQGSDAVGLFAMEYLIFDQTLIRDEMNDQLIDNPKSIQYFVAITEQLTNEADEMLTDWMNYGDSFKASLGTGVEESQTIMINSMINHVEFVVNTKIGKPFGKTDDIISSESVEAYNSLKSLEFISANLLSVDRMFTGDFTAEGHRTGFEDFLYFAGQEDLMDTILDQFALCNEDIDAIDVPLSVAVMEQPEKVEKLHEDMIELLVLLRVDMANILGSTITFTDNDGD